MFNTNFELIIEEAKKAHNLIEDLYIILLCDFTYYFVRDSDLAECYEISQNSGLYPLNIGYIKSQISYNKGFKIDTQFYSLKTQQDIELVNKDLLTPL